MISTQGAFGRLSGHVGAFVAGSMLLALRFRLGLPVSLLPVAVAAGATVLGETIAPAYTRARNH